MIGLKINVFQENENTAQCANMGIDISIELCDIKTITFYSIDAVGSYKDKNGKTYGVVICNGEDIVTDMTPDELIYTIENWLKSKNK